MAPNFVFVKYYLSQRKLPSTPQLWKLQVSQNLDRSAPGKDQLWFISRSGNLATRCLKTAKESDCRAGSQQELLKPNEVRHT